MSRALPPMQLVTQTDSGDARGWDDCGPSSSAMALFRGTGGKFAGTWREVRAAMERNGVHDTKNQNDPTTPEQNVVAILDIAPELRGAIFMRPAWKDLVAALRAGDGYVGCYYYGALPERARAPKFKKGTFGHFSYFEGDEQQVYLYDPLRPAKSDPVILTWDEFKVVVHWGVAPKNANRPRPGSFGIRAGKPAGARVDAPAAAPVAAPEEREVRPLPASTTSAAAPTPAPAPKPATPTELDQAVERLGRVDLAAVSGRALSAAQGAAAAASKVKGAPAKMITFLKYVKDNTGIDEALLEATRVFISTCVAMMLATGAPLLDMQAGDFKVVISGGLAAALNVVVRFLNPNDTQFGVQAKPKVDK